MLTKRLCVGFLVLALAGMVGRDLQAQGESGRIEGQVRRPDGTPVGGVTVVIDENKEAAVTDPKGNYAFPAVPAGSYTLILKLGTDSVTQTDVEVTAGRATRLETSVDWEIAFAETVTVHSASRRVERIVEAPAAVTVVDEERIEREASHGQLPKLLEFTPGAEVTQSGIYDFNLNTRGFNSSLNRRVATLVDGRDPSLPFLGAQEWAGIGLPLDDLASVELVRGPSAALYGANASSGVLNMTSKQPRHSTGGFVRVTAGELSTTNADLRWAHGLTDRWFLKVTGGLRDHGDFAVSRNAGVEYSVPCAAAGQTDCLPVEAVPLRPEDDDRIVFGSLRADRYLSNGSYFTLETGTSTIEGPVLQTGIGRVQLIDVERPWARFNYSADHVNVLAYYTGRDAPEQLAMSSGGNLALDSDRLTVEVQTRWDFAGDRVRLVAGASHTEEEIDSLGCPASIAPCPVPERQTLLFAPRAEDRQAVFAQADWQIGEPVRLVFAARLDESTLHDTEFSPKASLVWGVAEDHTLRFTYNQAFQVANYSEFFLQTDVAPTTDLTALEAICAAESISCGFDQPTRTLAVGNVSLDVEQVTMLEVGYNAILAKRAFLTVDVYRGENEQFITDLIPQIDPATGARTNPNFGPYAPPPSLSAGATAMLLAGLAADLTPAQLAILSNNVDGTPVMAARSYSNAGQVDTTGVDLGLNYYVDARWSLAFSYSWFDFDIDDPATPFSEQLLPNSPENKTSLGVTYSGSRFDGSLSGRWVDDFRWVVGPFQGDVESYTTVDLNANYRIGGSWKVGVSASNVIDDEHYEAFGGDLLGSRILGHVAYLW